MKRFVQAVLLLALATTPFSAGAQNGKALTLAECLEIALQNNNQLRSVRYEVDRAGAGITVARSSLLPSLNASLQSSRTRIGETVDSRDIPVVDPETGQPVINPETGRPVVDRVASIIPSRTFDSHTMSFSFNQTLFNGGRNWNSLKQAQATFEATAHRLTATRQSTLALVKQRYFELLKAVKLEQEFRLAVERSREQLERTRAMYEIGSVAQVDVYRSEVTLGQDEISLINQQNVVKIARANLNVAMGRDPETPLEIVELEVRPQPLGMTLEEAIAIAEQNNPDLKRFEFEMRSAEYGRKIAQAAFWPNIGFSLAYRRNNETLDRVYGDFGRNFAINFGASFNLNLFNGFADQAEVSRQTATYNIARENWLNSKRQIQIEVKQAFLNLEAFDQISKINERNLRAAEEEYRLAQERYRVGAGTQLEVTEAQVSLTRARVALVRAKYDEMIAWAQLEAALGRADVR